MLRDPLTGGAQRGQIHRQGGGWWAQGAGGGVGTEGLVGTERQWESRKVLEVMGDGRAAVSV